ncbi:MAG: PEP-CTERM sorting domain-containing protein, partial [Planctomycetota bacterium]|nr:PEP-CTERM sorting domain-containing protein [Planctomycetota bacterium]
DVPLSYLGSGAAGKGVSTGDPFAGLYVGAAGDPTRLYKDVITSGNESFTWNGVDDSSGITLYCPSISQNYPYYGYYWANPTLSSPADDNNYFKRSGGGGAGIEEPHSQGFFTLHFTNIPYSTYDIYISAVNAYAGTGSLAVSGGPTFSLGAYLPGGSGGWDSPVQITRSDLNPTGNAAGNWMIAQGMTGGAIDITFSDAGGWNGGIGAIQFVEVGGGPVWPGYLDGDFNLDGEVGPEDFGILILKDGFGLDNLPFGNHESWTLGDANDDGEIGPEDFGLLKDNFGLDGGPTGTYPLSNVPEPTTLALLALAGLAIHRKGG